MTNSKNIKFLFIHGAGGSSSKWRRVAEHVNEEEAVFIDLPGHGKNLSSLPATIEEYAGVLSRNITEDVIVVGHSMGGLIALELAAINERVKGVVLACSHYELPVHESILQKLAGGEFPLNFFYASYAKHADQALLEEEQQELDCTPVHTALSDFVCCDRYKSGEKVLSQISIPLLAVYGSEDRLVPRDASEKLAVQKPETVISKIDGAGHYAILENAEAFTKEIVKFREAVEKKAAYLN